MSMSLRPKIVEWPAASPGMNTIKNVWGLLKRKVSRRIQLDDMLEDVKKIAVQEWNGLSQQYIVKCKLSIGQCTEVCVHANGSCTTY